MGRTRDPAGFAALTARCTARPVGESTTRVALHRIAALLAAKGGSVNEITAGDCLELLSTAAQACTVPHQRSPYFYQLLHAVAVFSGDAAPTVAILTGQRQLSVTQLIDRCGLSSQPIRELLVDYLAERQVSIDHVGLVRLADTLGRLFWRDLENHHPGIGSLRLPPPVAAAAAARNNTSNVAERDLWPVKIQQRTSGGGWRTLAGLADFAVVRSYLATATKWHLSSLDVLQQLFTTGAWLPPAATPS